MTHVIPAGTTEPQNFELRDDGVAFNGDGFDIAIEIYQRVDGAWSLLTPSTTPASPVCTWQSAAAGRVRVSGLDTAALPSGTYLVRYRVTDSGGNVGYYPNGEKADIWRVVPIAA